MEAIEEWLSLQPDNVRRELVVSTQLESGDLYRIDNIQIKQFTPQFSLRQGNSENRTVPRICTAGSLMGCIAGYGQFFFDYFTGTPDGKWLANDVRYRGGAYITRIPYDRLLIPSKKMVGDVGWTGERWLVAYDEAHRTYPSELIGKVFVSSVDIRRQDRGDVFYTYFVMVEVSDDQGMQLTPKIRLDKGYYQVKLGPWRSTDNNTGDVKQEPAKNEITVTRIGKSEYSAAKGLGVDLLNYVTPASMWK